MTLFVPEAVLCSLPCRLGSWQTVPNLATRPVAVLPPIKGSIGLQVLVLKNSKPHYTVAEPPMTTSKQTVFTLKRFLSSAPTATTKQHVFKSEGRIPVFTSRQKAQAWLDK
jgi:hypothetical protein